ncbi:hypothetical protein Pan54_36990 [Rubinisphaera italica]|uniref:Uncharacterized protein n=1 Tax=Rubinisphaera italica TaxID=2527969 RepID=A0A5C5XJN6_9PLAN|nr:hypothetical protein Pan54_36990 [Rubinisphaera italica]
MGPGKSTEFARNQVHQEVPVPHPDFIVTKNGSNKSHFLNKRKLMCLLLSDMLNGRYIVILVQNDLLRDLIACRRSFLRFLLFYYSVF